jgi:G patch domain-containing protein 1
LKKQEDPAEAAAKIGMYGPMTRSIVQFFPTRLLCKRFNVKPPTHVQLDPDRATGDDSYVVDGGKNQSAGPAATSSFVPGARLELVSESAMNDIIRESGGFNAQFTATSGRSESDATEKPKEVVKVDAERNEALEADRAGDAVFKAIFGSDDEDEG